MIVAYTIFIRTLHGVLDGIRCLALASAAIRERRTPGSRGLLGFFVFKDKHRRPPRNGIARLSSGPTFINTPRPEAFKMSSIEG